MSNQRNGTRSMGRVKIITVDTLLRLQVCHIFIWGILVPGGDLSTDYVSTTSKRQLTGLVSSVRTRLLPELYVSCPLLLPIRFSPIVQRSRYPLNRKQTVLQ